MKSLVNLNIPVILALAGALSLVGCKANSSHLLSGKSYGTVDKEKAISANDLMGQSHIKAESELLGKVVTFKDLQAVEVGEIDTTKNACEIEFEAMGAQVEKISIQLVVNFNRTPNEVLEDIRKWDSLSNTTNSFEIDSSAMQVDNLLEIKDRLCNRPQILDCTAGKDSDFGRCPFEKGKFHLSGRVFSVLRTSSAPLRIMMTPTGYSSP
ncbi:MAG: hypothetical protein IPK50_05765 [Fibrobacterota bacterium]|nr:MAG: hypothetical protein IPK50_05765 [Fibrobacterota bacterium]